MFTNLRRDISSFAIASLLAVAGVATASAQTDLTFSSGSRFSEGKWTKIGVPSTGVCRITYDELRTMGFVAPETVAVFGRGGYALDSNFKDKNGNVLYSDELAPVSTMHKDNAIYFYALGPQSVKYSANGVYRESNNVYTNKAYYFLTENSSDAKFMTEANALPTTDPTSVYDKAFGYQVFEEDNLFPFETGEEFFGWNLLTAPGYKVTFPYSIPGSVAGDKVKAAYYGVAKIKNNSTKIDLSLASGNVNEKIGEVSFSSISTDSYYGYAFGYNVPVYLEGTLPGSEGELTVLLATPSYASFAMTDYVVLTAPRSLAFQSGEKSYEVYTADYNADLGPVAIASAPENLVVWDVVDSNDAILLPYTIDESGTAYVTGLREGNQQRKLVAFSPASDFVKVTGFENIAHQNLHALAKQEIPTMVIITTPELKSEAMRLAELHRTYQNENVVVATSDEILNEFSQGTPDPMAYRAFSRMFYDADNSSSRTFSSVMLFGPMRMDNRGTLTPLPDYNLLLCKETPQSDSGTTSFTILDYYGQMADYYGNDKSNSLYYLRQLDLAVGVVPANSPNAASLYVDKVEKWLTDESVAHWVSNVAYTADGTNNNEHINECNDVADNTWQRISNSFTPHKLFNNSFPDIDVRKNFLTVLNNGAIWTNYLGHASSLGLNTVLWSRGDYTKLNNGRLGFMFFGGCTITDFDRGGQGSGEEMILSTPYGLIGGILSTRTTLSISNWRLLEDLTKSALLNTPFGSDPFTLLSEPRTFGEITRMAFNKNTRGNTNKLAYVLMCDPALKSLMPSADVVITSSGKEVSEVTPGTFITIEGKITARDGSLLNQFNGEAVVNLFAPEISLPTRKVGDSPSIDIVHDNFLLASIPFEVTNGKFSGSFRVPESLASENEKVTFRIGAFDPSTRRTAAGDQIATVLPFSKASTVDTESPVIEEFYVNTPSFSQGDAVGADNVIYAVISDNIAMNSCNLSAGNNFSLKIDGKNSGANLWQYLSLGNDGRTLTMRYPKNGLSNGLHTVQIEAFDLSGNACSASLLFNVQTDSPLATTLQASAAVVRDDVTVNLKTDADAGYTVNEATLVLTDSLGEVVKTVKASGDSVEWDATDNSGNRVDPGVYYAHCRYTTNSGASGISDPIRLVVMRPAN